MSHSNIEVQQKVHSMLWKLVMYRGVILIIAGVILTFFAQTTLSALVFIMGIYWLVDGIITTYKAVNGRKVFTEWKWAVFTGIIGIVAGLVVIFHPSMTAILSTSFIAWFLGIAAFIYGVFGIATGLKLPKETNGKVNMMLGGILSILFASMLISSPYISTIALVNTIGIIALAGGLVIIFIAFGLKKKSQEN